MVLEIRRALEELKSGSSQGYRRLYDATYEEVYCRSLLIIQKEDQALEFIKDFYKDVFGALEEADDAFDKERWFLHRFYQKLRKHYHRLLGKQEKTDSDSIKTLAEIPATFPLLHRIMLVMSFKDDFSAAEISAIYGLAEDKIQTELEKLGKVLPTITKDQPESVAAYLDNWKLLLLGASSQTVNNSSQDWVETVYTDASKAAGVSAEPVVKKEETDDFEYFVAEPEPEKPKKIVPIVREEPEEEEEEEYDEDEDDEEYDDEEYDEEEEDEYDDRYDWDMEDDGRKMIILGIVLAVIIVAIVGVLGFRLLSKGGDTEKVPDQTEQEEGEDDNKLIIKGEEGSEDSVEPEENIEAEPPAEEVPEEPAEEPVEAEPLVMRVTGNTINIRSESNTNSTVLTKVKKDEKVEVLGDPTGEWVQIRCIEQNNEEGYMMSQYLSNIE